MSIAILPTSALPASPALSATSSSSFTSTASRPKTLHRKPVPSAAFPLEPPAFTFEFSFSPPASPDTGPSTLDQPGSPVSSVQHLSLDSPCRARDLSSPEMHDQPSSEDGYSSDGEFGGGSGPYRDGGKFGATLVRDVRYANPALCGPHQSLGESSYKGRVINDPQAVQHLFGASLQRSRRTSPTEAAFPVEADPTETLVNAHEEIEADYHLELAGRAPESASMVASGSSSSAASIHSAKTGMLLKARRAAAAKSTWKDEFADMAEEENVVRSTDNDDPEEFVFQPPYPKEEHRRLPRTPSRKRGDIDAGVHSLDSPSEGASLAADDDDAHGVLDRFKRNRKHFNLNLSLPGSNQSSRSSSPISLASIGSPASIKADSYQTGLRGASSPSPAAASCPVSPALSSTRSFNTKLASGFNLGPSIDLASAHMIFQESIPRICTPEPVSENGDSSSGGHKPFDFLLPRAENKSTSPAYRVRHKHSDSTPGFGLRELREMRQAADLIERDAKRPTHSRSSSFAEKKLKRKPVPQFVGENDGNDTLEVQLDVTKSSGGFFDPTFTFPVSTAAVAPQTVVLSVDESSSDSTRTSSDSFESPAFPQTPAYMPEFGMLAPAGQFGRRRSVSLSDMDSVFHFNTAAKPPPSSFGQTDGAHLALALGGLSVHSPSGGPESPQSTALDPCATPLASHTSFFDVVSASHAKGRHHHAPSFSRSPPVPAIPSPHEGEVMGASIERRAGEVGSPSNPYGLQGRKTFGSMRRKMAKASSPRN